MRTIRTVWISVALIVVATIIAFQGGLDNGFTNWDDPAYVVENPDIRSLDLSAIGRHFTTFAMGNYHPLTMLSYSVDHRLHGLDPTGYYVTNVGLHLLNALLVFAFIRLLCGIHVVALGTALLFAVHPMHVESVAWISARKDVLSGLFFLAACCTHVRYLRGGRGAAWYAATVVFFLGALLSKALSVTLPLVLLAMDWYLLGRLDRRAVVEKIPLLILSLACGLVAVEAQQVAGAFWDQPMSQPWDRLAIASVALVTYLWRVFVPLGLSAYHPYPEQLSVFHHLAPLLWVGILITLPRCRRSQRELLFGALFFLSTIVLTLQLIPVGRAVTAERYSYLPYVGLFFAVGHLAHRYVGPPQRGLVMVVATVCLVACVFLSRQRVEVWADSETLWSDAIAKSDRADLALLNRGKARLDAGSVEAAVADWTRAVAIRPNYAKAYYDRGNARLALGNLGGAVADYTSAIRSDRDLAPAYNNRAKVLTLQGKSEQALADCEKALVLNPDYPEAYFNRSQLHLRARRYGRALADLDRAIELGPDAESYLARGNVHYQQSSLDSALQDYTRAIAYRPDFAIAHYNRGRALLAAGKPEAAVGDLRRAVSLFADSDAEEARQRALTLLRHLDRK